MKFLLLLAILAVAYLIWRHSRVTHGDAPPRRAAPDKAPQDMVCCAVCSVHLPRGDAVAGPDGRMYCSQEHLLQSSR